MSVPNEKEVPTTGVRLLVPDSLDRVTPLVKPGWRINIKKDTSGKVTELEWIGGSVPTGQKDVFQFSARASTTPTTLIWKIYQTYRGGEVAAWDRDPKALKEGEERVANPYSTTLVAATSSPVSKETKDSQRLPMTLSIAALAFSLISLWSARTTSRA